MRPEHPDGREASMGAGARGQVPPTSSTPNSGRLGGIGGAPASRQLEWSPARPFWELFGVMQMDGFGRVEKNKRSCCGINPNSVKMFVQCLIFHLS